MTLTVQLPNGIQVRALNRLDPPMLYHEIFAARTYAKHGISLSEGDCVFDVGANIGLYSIALARELPGLRLFLFEPIPAIFAVLQQNVAEHLASANVRLLNIGLGCRAGNVWFDYNRNLTIVGSAHARVTKRAARRDTRLSTWASACVRDLQRMGMLHPRLAALLLAALASRIFSGLALALVGITGLALALPRLFSRRRIEAPVRRLSYIIRAYAVERIDLVKIALEGGELDVMLGIYDDDWPRIRQFVIEVYDVDGRLEGLRTLLESRGYRVAVDQEDWSLHQLLGIYTLYAVRAPEPPPLG